MMKLFKASLAAAFLLAAMPVAAPIFGVDHGAQAKPYAKKKVAKKRAYGKQGKYQYQYVPNANGRPGAWR